MSEPENTTTASAVLQRLMPACGAVYLGVLAANAMAVPGELSWASVGVAGLSVALITAGFGVVAGLLRPVLRPSVSLGVRSLLAGLAAPLTAGVLSVFAQGASLASISVLTLGAGAATGLVVLGSGTGRRRPAVPLDADVQAELQRLDAELALAYAVEPVLPGDDRRHPRLPDQRLPEARPAAPPRPRPSDAP